MSARDLDVMARRRRAHRALRHVHAAVTTDLQDRTSAVEGPLSARLPSSSTGRDIPAGAAGPVLQARST